MTNDHGPIRYHKQVQNIDWSKASYCYGPPLRFKNSAILAFITIVITYGSVGLFVWFFAAFITGQ